MTRESSTSTESETDARSASDNERFGYANQRFEVVSNDAVMLECGSCGAIYSDYHDTCPICDEEVSSSDIYSGGDE